MHDQPMRVRTLRYLARTPLMRPAEGEIVVHNHVRPPGFPNIKVGFNGFRAWLAGEGDPSHPEYGGEYEVERCPCPWAPEIGEHYRVQRRSGQRRREQEVDEDE